MVERVLYDTDLIISAYFTDQSTHFKAKQVFSHSNFTQEFILNITLQETATTVSKKFSQNDAKNIVKDIKLTDVVVVFLSMDDENMVWREFYKNTKNGTSFVDCANLVMAKKLDCKIASFDKFYPKSILV